MRGAAAAFLLIATVILRLTGLYAQYREVLYAAGLSLDCLLPRQGMPVFEVGRAISEGLRIIDGVAFGAIFAALHGRLPGRFSAVMGVVSSVFLWILCMVGLIYLFLGLLDEHWGGLSSWGGASAGSSLLEALFSLAATVAFGALVGAHGADSDRRELHRPGATRRRCWLAGSRGYSCGCGPLYRIWSYVCSGM